MWLWISILSLAIPEIASQSMQKSPNFEPFELAQLLEAEGL
jgi:hypothetical protein